MMSMLTSIKIQLGAERRNESGVVCGQPIIGMKPAAHQANPRDMGGLAL